MKPVSLRPGIYAVGAPDWNRQLFDQLIPLPDGTSYNSYLIKADKTVLIDTVDPTKTDVLMNNLKAAGVEHIDYIVTNHAEQDHSGSLPAVLGRYPMAKVYCTPKCKTFLMDLLPIPEDKFVTVADKETLSLGNKMLEFIYFPWVHWPETMLTFLREDKVLFTCDLFGSHLASTEVFVTDECQVHEAAKRYYGEIMMPFRTNIQKDIVKLDNYNIDIIAPSHGPVYNKPHFIIDAYKDWVSDEPKNLVVLPYISMHGSTQMMVDYLVASLKERAVPVKVFDLTVTDVGKLAIWLVDAATVVIGTPAMLSAAHPWVIFATYVINAFRPRIKYTSIIGSYEWGGRVVEQINGMLTALKTEALPPVISKGLPKEADFKALDSLSDTIAEKHKTLPRLAPPCLAERGK